MEAWRSITFSLADNEDPCHWWYVGHRETWHNHLVVESFTGGALGWDSNIRESISRSHVSGI